MTSQAYANRKHIRPAESGDAKPSTHGDRPRRVMVVGLGNIGSFLTTLVSQQVDSICLVDHDIVEQHNVENQFYGPEDIGRPKVDVLADRLASVAPRLNVQTHASELQDVPLGHFADVDVVLAGLDSLGARQSLSEIVYPLQIPYIDGAVGDPFEVRVQVLLPGAACLECSWGAGQYRQLTTEYSCRPQGDDSGSRVSAPRTNAPAAAGAATASLMVAQLERIFSEQRPDESYEINGDLFAGRLVTSRRRRNAACHYSHATAGSLLKVEKPFQAVMIGDVIEAANSFHAGNSMQLPEAQLFFRRGVLNHVFDRGLFNDALSIALAELQPHQDIRLTELGLTQRDRVTLESLTRDGEANLISQICFEHESLVHPETIHQS